MTQIGTPTVNPLKEVPMSYAQQARRLFAVRPWLVSAVALVALLVVASLALMQVRNRRVTASSEARPRPAAALAPIWAPPPGQEFMNPSWVPPQAQDPSWVPPQAQAYVNPRVAPAPKLNTPFDPGTGSVYDERFQPKRAP
jgi:hypothetical protein